MPGGGSRVLGNAGMTRFGSLFSGVGGLDRALKACGWEPAWQVENDEFCTKILERHWPDVRRYGDIREIDWRAVEPVELVCAGFPCQPFSVAGQNRGEDDERNMWPETYRAVRELRPRYVFLENVPGLLAHGYFGRILGDLAQGGYDAVWDTFTAAEVGATHRRERLFILAYALGHPEGEQRQGRAESAGRAGQALPGRSGATVAIAEGEQMGAAGLSWQSAGFPPGPDDRAAWARVLAEVPALEPAVCRSTSRISAWMDCLDRDEAHKLVLAYANATQAQPFEALHDLWDAHGPSGQDDWAPRRFPDIRSEEVLFAYLRQLARDGEQGRTSLASAATSEGCLRSLWMDQIVTCPSCGWRPHSRRSKEHSDALRTLSRLLAQHAQTAWTRSAESDALANRTHRLRALGNAVVPAQGAYALRRLWRRVMAL